MNSEEELVMLFEELSKIKRSSIMTSIILAAIGIVMILCPPQYVGSLVAVLGYVLAILSGVMILNYITNKKSLINCVKFAGALIILLLGIAILVFENIMLFIGIVFGVVLVADGLITMINTWMYARRAKLKGWWLLVLFSLLLIAGGVIILVNPWWNETLKLFDVIGMMLLFSSLVGIVRLIIIWPIKDEED